MQEMSSGLVGLLASCLKDAARVLDILPGFALLAGTVAAANISLGQGSKGRTPASEGSSRSTTSMSTPLVEPHARPAGIFAQFSTA